eukprot:CAMPEP_0116129726 /NCGR_PEP_ID=MMETSP0329-20121206/8071_1 /TAXON_ID=697910 /ORGANISM="Pseudo-nitzschia arenysensis, Strain B593" /LENGTH=396 /DNA_ID=CAMNT_0003623999 /DNA_START=68 /DNA_END=1258 /DNA_ORIENTATION=-
MEELLKPSGISIPLLLKRKWEKQQQRQQEQDPASLGEEKGDQTLETKDSDASNIGSTCEPENEKPSSDIWEPQLRLSMDQELTRDQKNELSNRVFTASELEERIMKTTAAMFDIQRQLYRGEEIYYEDTYGHGSIYKGWDAFVDSASVSGSGGTQTSSNRRVPVDSRWFSTSCGSVSRTKPPATFPPPLISQPILSVAKLSSIPEQEQAAASSKIALQPNENVSNATTTTTPSTESASETPQPSSTRIRQRMAASSEKGGNCESNSRPATPVGDGRSVDSSSTKKKRKTTAMTSSDEPSSKKANQKSSSADETKRPKLANATKPGGTGAGATKGSKVERDISTVKAGAKSSKSEKKEGSSTPGPKSNKAENSTPAKREKDSETLVPRKRGRPRRKT